MKQNIKIRSVYTKRVTKREDTIKSIMKRSYGVQNHFNITKTEKFSFVQKER